MGEVDPVVDLIMLVMMVAFMVTCVVVPVMILHKLGALKYIFAITCIVVLFIFGVAVIAG